MKLLEFVFGFAFTFFTRFIRIFPNNDPIMGIMLPSARSNIIHSALFAFLAMFVFDFFTSGIGVWTVATSLTYGLLAIIFGLYFKNKEIHYSTYAFSAIVGVIIFDIITGPLLSTFIFNQSLLITTVSQIPFTISHLVSALAYTLVLVPVLDISVRKELQVKLNSLKNQIIFLSNNWRGFF